MYLGVYFIVHYLRVIVVVIKFIYGIWECGGIAFTSWCPLHNFNTPSVWPLDAFMIYIICIWLRSIY